MRYRLRTLLILLAVVPPVLAGMWWMLTRAGLLNTIEFVIGVVVFVGSLASWHFAIKRNLGW